MKRGWLATAHFELEGAYIVVTIDLVARIIQLTSRSLSTICTTAHAILGHSVREARQGIRALIFMGDSLKKLVLCRDGLDGILQFRFLADGLCSLLETVPDGLARLIWTESLFGRVS